MCVSVGDKGEDYPKTELTRLKAMVDSKISDKKKELFRSVFNGRILISYSGIVISYCKMADFMILKKQTGQGSISCQRSSQLRTSNLVVVGRRICKEPGSCGVGCGVWHGFV